MRKFLSLLVALATVTMAWAAQGGTLTSSKTPIDPTQTVTLTYDGTGTNFANWEPSCFIHAWLVAADGQTLSKSYSTDWASCNGDGDYASLASKLKMTYSGTKGKYTISMNIKEFFNVADTDLPKIGKLGVIVRAQYEGDDNKTNDMFVNVAYTAPASKVTYTALTKAPTTGNWAGQYLIVFADNKAHATVTGSDLAATSDALTIDEGEIEINSTDKYYVTVELMQGGYSIKLPSGKYMVCGKNKISQSATPVALSLNYTTSGVEIVSTDENEYTLYCNTSGTNKYYRAYTPKTASNYALPTLYRTGDEAPALQTLYFVNTLDWTKVNAFVWPATGDAYKGWPGEAMYKTADQVNGKDIYAYRFPATFVNAIFNNGTDQTADLVWDAAKPYFVPGAKNGEGKYEGTWYASKDDIPVPGKYYITGDSALVVDAGLASDKAWAPAAIKADADTTVLNLKAGVEYKLKVTVDGTWATALGFDALSETAEGLSADADNNICFKLAEAGAVQVVYFKEGEKVTYKLIGNFYVKPVIVETLNLVPNMWSEASAKMAAWVWGEDLAGAWTPFFAGEGDTLSVKINAEADSIIFVRFNSAVAAPTWDEPGTNIWNRVKDDKIDHVGLTYTITAWGDEGVSVGQWTPYEPVVPGKYYITGDSALVVDAGLTADKAWAPAAINADADTTVLNLKAGVDYKLKVTVDGTWATALGYDNLSEKAEGLSADADNNICFKLADAGAVQVVYFKEGDKVTYKLIGNFYVKPVIVETLNLVPNMWSEASAKMAAWVWGEDLAGAWTPFFAGEGDTLSVKINAEADSIIFVRFASEVAAPDWEATIWNRVKDDKIDHVGLTYTITAWGDEGVSVGQWTPYEPAGGCDWDNLPWLGSADAAYAEQFKVCVGDPKPTEVVNIQKPGFATEIGIYITFPSAAFTSFSLPESAYDIQGAGVIFHLSAFTARETEVTVVCESKDYIFTVFNKKGGEPEKVYTIVGEAALVGVEWNPEATDNDMAKQADGSYKLVKENVALEAKGYEYKVIEGHAWGGWELPTGGANQTLTITAAGTYNVTFTLSADLATLTAEATPVGPAPEKVYTIVGVAALVGVEWNPEATENDMAKQADGSYKLVKENVALASGAYEYKVVEGHVWTGWQIPAEGNQSLTIDAAGVYNVTFTLDAALTTLTANAVSVGPMPEQEYGLMIDGTTFIKAQPNPATANEYMVLDVALTAGQTLQIYDKTHEVGWAIDKWNEGSYKFEIKDNKYIVSETAKYDFYVNLEYGNDYIYVAKKETPSAIENLLAPANEMRKVMIDGKLYIMRDGKVYSAQGQLIR